jgi:uncharacterized protein YjbI with pentapeptide repeats
MPSLFRRILSNHSAKRQAAPREQNAAATVAIEDAPAADAAQAETEAAQNIGVEEPIAEATHADAVAKAAGESTPPEAVSADETHGFELDGRGLIPADQLPPAADMLAQLFPSEKESDPFSSDAEEGAREIEMQAANEAASLPQFAEPINDSNDAAPEPAQEPVAEAGEPAAEEAPDEPTLEKATEPIAASELAESATESEFTAANGSVQNDAADTAHEASSNALIEAATEAETASGAPGRAEQTDSADGQLTADDMQGLYGSGEPVAENIQIARKAAEPAEGDEAIAFPESSAEVAEPTEPPREAADEEIVKAASMAALESPASSGRDWRLEEKLASHLEWLDSRGKQGLRADLSDADLEGQELIGVKLKYADLHDANLRAADLLLADLRDASLVRADLEDSCLVGANLEAANLEGASLETAMGLVPRQIAGANLRDALLPPQIMEFDAAAKFARASRIAWNCFAPLVPGVLLSWLIIWKAKDAQMLTDSAVIPYLHSRTAAAALPTTQIFLLAPLVISTLYLVFQFRLQKVWEAALELPAIFPDGHPLDDRGPGLILGLLRTHFWWVSRERTSTQWVEKTICVLVAYWAVPFTLTLFWARYLTMQEAKGTLLQTLLVAVATGLALHATLRTGRTQEHWTAERKWAARMMDGVRRISPLITAGVLGFILLLLSIGTMLGVPHARSRAPQYSQASVRRWAADVFWAFGFDPYADLTEATLSRKPKGWTGANAQVASVIGPQLNEAKFRYAQAYGVFLANAHLWQSDFEGAYLSEADLRGADLGHSDLRHTILDGALLSGANLNRARMDGAILARGDLRWANLSYASLAHATLVDAQLNGATLYDAQLTSASLARADLEKVDLRGAILNAADLNHANLQQALLWSAKLPGANLYGAKLQDAVAIDADLRGADLREAQFAGTVLSDANLSGANLDRADLRGALEVTASQVCSSKSRRGALLSDALATQVTAQCGGLQ